MPDVKKIVLGVLLAGQLLCPCLAAAGTLPDGARSAHASHGAPNENDDIKTADAPCDPAGADCCDKVTIAATTKTANESGDDADYGLLAAPPDPVVREQEARCSDPPGADERLSHSPVELKDLKLE